MRGGIKGVDHYEQVREVFMQGVAWTIKQNNTSNTQLEVENHALKAAMAENKVSLEQMKFNELCRCCAENAVIASGESLEG